MSGRTQEQTVPPWKRGDGSDRMQNHLYAESIFERELEGGTIQVVERVRPREGVTNAYLRATYRLVEVVGGKPRIVFLDDTQKDVRRRADKRAG